MLRVRAVCNTLLYILIFFLLLFLLQENDLLHRMLIAFLSKSAAKVQKICDFMQKKSAIPTKIILKVADFLLNSPIQSPSSTPVTSSRVLYDVRHRHNNARAGDRILLYRDSQWSYVDNG